MDATQGSERSVAESYCVVYLLHGTEWKVTGEGWSQVHLYQDADDGSYRIVGWTVGDLAVVINCNVTGSCKYKKKSEDFHKFTDEEEGATYGFGFYKKEESLTESEKFMKAVTEAIESQKQVEKVELAPMEIGSAGVKGDDVYTADNQIPMGKLKILSPKNLKAEDARDKDPVEDTATKKKNQVAGVECGKRVEPLRYPAHESRQVRSQEPDILGPAQGVGATA